MTTEPITEPVEEKPDRLEFGIDRGQETAWGARGILHSGMHPVVDLLWDRQSNRGARFDELATKMNAGPLKKALEEGKWMPPHKHREKVLYLDDEITIVGNTNASYGYLYLGAWFVDEE